MLCPKFLQKREDLTRMNLLNLPEPPPGKTGWPWTEIPEPLPETMPDGSSWTKISVVTPSFNQGQFIEETIRSVLLQGYPNLEFIIIDGGSTDNTIETIKKYEPWLAFWVSEPDRGQSHAINKGINKATGEFLFWLNSDDICLPNAFIEVIKAFITHPEKKLVIGQARIMNDTGEIIGELRSQFIDWEELATNPRNSVRQISSFFRKELFELVDVDEELQIAMDSDLLFRITQLHVPLIISNYLTAYRLHSQAKTSSQLIKGYWETDNLRLKYLREKQLLRKYRSRSSSNWLSLSGSGNYPMLTSINCLLRSILIKPSVLFDRRFWSTLRKVSSNIQKTA